MLQFKGGKKQEIEEDDNYNREDFLFRLRKLQKVVSKSGIDGILIINGIDSKRNEENEKVTKWLVEGQSGLNVLNSYMKEMFDELILLVTVDGLHIHCEREAYQYMWNYLTFPNVYVYLNQHNDDLDLKENNKIAFFVRSMQKVKKVGMIPSSKEKGNVKNIEKWPLLQAYALEGTGRGYFSQSHSIVNVGLAVNELFRQYDRHSLMGVDRKGKYIGHSIQRVLTEYGRIRARDIHHWTGQQLTQELIQQFELEELTDNVKPLAKDWGKPGITLVDQTLMQVENVDLVSKLRVARTYFTCVNAPQHVYGVQQVISEEDDQLKQYILQWQDNPHFHYESTQISEYLALKQAFHQVLGELTGNAKNVNVTFIKNRLKQLLDTEQLEVLLGIYNSFGESACLVKEVQGYKYSTLVYCLRVQKGNLLYADSFIILDHLTLVVTQQVPSLRFLLNHQQQLQFFEDFSKLRYVIPYDLLGKQVKFNDRHDPIDGCGLKVEVEQEVLEWSCKVKVYPLGMSLATETIGYIFILFKEVSRLEVFDDCLAFHYEHTPILAAIPTQVLYSTIPHFHVKDTILTLFKSLGYNYSYTQGPHFHQHSLKSTQTTLNFQYLQYKQNNYNKTIKANTFTFEQFVEVQQELKGEKKQKKEEEKEEEKEFVEWVVIEGRDVEDISDIGVNIQNIIKDNLKVKCGLYLQQECEWLLEQQTHNIQQVIHTQGLNKGDYLVVVVKEKGQVDIKDDWIQKVMKGSRLKMKVTRVCIGRKDLLEMLGESHRRVMPGYSQLVLLDRKGTSQQHFDQWCSTLRTAYSHQTYGFCINSKCTPSDVLQVLQHNDYYSPVQQHLRHLYSHLNATLPLFTSNYKFISHRLPVNMSLFQKFMQNTLMNRHQGYLQPFLTCLEQETPVEVDKRNMSDEQLLQLQMESLKQQIGEEDQRQHCMKVEYVEGWLLDENNQVQRVWLDKDVMNSKVASEVEGKEETINVKNRKYKVQVYNTPVTLGLIVRGHHLQHLTQLDTLFTQHHAPLKQPLLTPQHLSTQLIQQLEINNSRVGCDNGQFFDGQHFRDYEGKILPGHPKQDQLIEKYLKEQNYQIAEINRQKEKEWKQFVFKYKYEGENNK